MKLDNNTLLNLFQNGHRAIEGIKFGRCTFCGLAQSYWNKWTCSRFKTEKKELQYDNSNCENPGYC